MLVVIDTNVFVRESLLLRASIGPLLLHFLQAKKGRLFIPGILRREYVEQAVETVRDARREIEPRLGRVHAIVGEMNEYQLPADKEVEAGAEARLRELAPLAMEAATTDEIMIAAGHRSLDKRAPCTKTDHGYKDCLIWESILRLPAGSEVHLVTHDRAFFEGDKIAPTLAAEGRARGIAVAAHQSLDVVLGLLQDGQPPLDFDRVNAALDDVLQPLLEKLTGQWGLGDILEAASQLVPYFTERVDRIFVTFTRAYLIDRALVDSNELQSPTLLISGSFIWLESAGALEQLQVHSERLNDAAGNVVRENVTVYAGIGAISFGPRRIPYKVKGLLSGERTRPNKAGA